MTGLAEAHDVRDKPIFGDGRRRSNRRMRLGVAGGGCGLWVETCETKAHSRLGAEQIRSLGFLGFSDLGRFNPVLTGLSAFSILEVARTG
ncbi:hypothetical protein PIB30_103180, partial [Stylosanthes scabra]|nr:hypothetical protein [Stylosanthes scabra]